MTLQMVVDSVDGMDEGIAKLYVEKDGKFHLDVDGDHVKNEDPNRIPKSRLDAEIEKRKDSEKSMAEIAESFIEDLPEDMRDLVPDLAPAAKIKWIKAAQAKGLFDQKPVEGIDTKRPKGKQAENLDGLSPQTLMAKGYK